MSVTVTLIAVGVVLAVYLLGRLVSRSWARAGASIDGILAEVTAAPSNSGLVPSPARSAVR